MTSPKAVCILFQALTALIVIEFFPYKFVWNEGLNNLLVEEADVLWLCISEQSVNQLSKIDGNVLLKYLLTKGTFSSWILSSNWSKFCFSNRGFEWQYLGWKLIIFPNTLEDRQSIYCIQISSPNHIGIINMWVKDCIIDSFNVLTLTKFQILKRRAFALFNFIAISETFSISNFHQFQCQDI